MSVKAKKKRRLLFLLVGAAVVLVLGLAGYWLRTMQIENRLRQNRADGLAALQAQDYFNALHKVGSWLQRHPDDAEALYAYAQARENVEEPENKHLAQAMRLYVRLLDMQPANAEARHKLLDLYLRTGYGTEAVLASDELLRLNRSDAVAVRAKAIASARLGKATEALQFARDYNKLAPDDFEGHLLTMELTLKRGGGGASDVLKQAAELQKAHPNDPRFDVLRSIACAAAARESAAGGRLDEANARRNEAIDWARKAAKAELRDAALVVQLVRQLESLDLFGEALTLLDRAAGSDIKSASAAANGTGAGKDRGRLERELVSRWLQLKRYPKVAEFLRGLDPDDTKAPAELLAYRSIALIESGRRADVAPILQALAARKGDAVANAWASAVPVVFAEQKPAAPAVIAACEQALASVPDNAFLRFHLGEAYARLNEGEAALEQWARAYRAAPAWPDPLIRIARVSLAMRQPLQAREAARMAALRSPDNVEALSLQAVAWAGSMSGTAEVGDVLKLIDKVQVLSPGEEQTLPVRIALLARYRSADEAKRAVNSTLDGGQKLTESALLRLATLSAEQKLGVEQRCLATAQKAYGLTPNVAFVRSVLISDAGQPDQAISTYEAAQAKHGASEDRAWKLGLAQLLERVGSPRAAQNWISLADGSPQDLEIQQTALGARSAQSDPAFVDRVVGRLRELSGGYGTHWRLAQAQALLLGAPSDQRASEAVTVLDGVLKANPNHPGARQLLADAQERLGNTKEAAQHLEVAFNADASNRVALRLARLAQARRDFKSARQYVARVMETASVSPEERREVAVLLTRQGESQQALDYLLAGGAQPGGRSADLVLAGLYEERGKFKEAESIYVRLLEAPTVEVIQEAAGFFASRGRSDDAKRVLGRLDQLELKPGVKEMVLGLHHLHRGDPEEALGHFKSATETAPGDASGWQRYVVCALAMGKVDEAVAAAGRAAQALPERERQPFQTLKQHEQLVAELKADEGARVLFPGLLQASADAAAAADALKVLADAKRNGTPAANVSAQLRQLSDRHPRFLPLQVLVAQRYLASSQPDDAASLAERAMQLHPTAAEPAKLAVQSLAQMGNWNDALDAAQQWRDRSVNQPLAADQMIAASHLALGRPAKAAETLQPHIEKLIADPDKHAELITLYVRAQIGAGKTDEAAELLRPLLSRSSQWRRTWIELASRGVPDAGVAAAWLKEVRAASSEQSAADEIHLALGWHLLSQRSTKLEHAQAARGALTEASKRTEALNDMPAGELVTLGMLHENNGNTAEAEAAYRRAVQIDGTAAEALNNLAMLIVGRKGDLTEAEAFAAKAVEVNPKAPSFLDTLATVQAARKDFTNAVASSGKAVSLEPQNVKWRIYLCSVLVQAGQLQKAREVLGEIEKMNPDPGSLSPYARERLASVRASLKDTGARS